MFVSQRGTVTRPARPSRTTDTQLSWFHQTVSQRGFRQRRSSGADPALSLQVSRTTSWPSWPPLKGTTSPPSSTTAAASRSSSPSPPPPPTCRRPCPRPWRGEVLLCRVRVRLCESVTSSLFLQPRRGQNQVDRFGFHQGLHQVPRPRVPQ